MGIGRVLEQGCRTPNSAEAISILRLCEDYEAEKRRLAQQACIGSRHLQSVHVLLDKGWADLQPEACNQIELSMTSGVTKVGVQIHGSLYIIDISEGQESMQTNPASGKACLLPIIAADTSSARRACRGGA